MTRIEISEKLNEIFRNIFDDDEIIISDTTTASDIEDWDSLEQINLIVAIEKQFNLKFNIKEVNGLRNVGEMIDVIMEKLK